MTAPCDAESTSRRGATVSASVELEAVGGDSKVTVGGGCCSVVRASSFSPSSRRSTAASAPPATSSTTTAPTAIQRVRRFPAAGGVGGGSTGDRLVHAGLDPRRLGRERCRRGRGPVSRRQRRAAAPAVPRALGLLVAAARTDQRRRDVPGRCGQPAARPAPTAPRRCRRTGSPPALRCRSSRRSSCVKPGRSSCRSVLPAGAPRRSSRSSVSMSVRPRARRSARRRGSRSPAPRRCADDRSIVDLRKRFGRRDDRRVLR